MPKRTPAITPAELRILKVVWRLKLATVRQVKDALTTEGGDAPAYTTVMTIMNALGEKGVLSVDKARQPYVYAPAISRERVLGDRLQQFLRTVFDGQAGELVLRLVEDEELSPEDLRRIEKKIEDRERQREPDDRRRLDPRQEDGE